MKKWELKPGMETDAPEFRDLIKLSSYGELLQGKRVALVGGAEKTEPVDEYDLVVRINNSWIKTKGRMDILYWDLCHQFVLNLDLKFCHIFMMQDNAQDCMRWCKQHRIPAAYYCLSPCGAKVDHPYYWTWPLSQELQTRPFTGVLAIYHILQYQVAELFVTGFTFYETKGWHRCKRGPHLIFPQWTWLRKVCLLNPRIRVDEELQRILHIQRASEEGDTKGSGSAFKEMERGE